MAEPDGISPKVRDNLPNLGSNIQSMQLLDDETLRKLKMLGGGRMTLGDINLYLYLLKRKARIEAPMMGGKLQLEASPDKAMLQWRKEF